MSLQKIYSVFQNINSCTDWSLQLLRVSKSRRDGAHYASREIRLSPPGRIMEFVNEVADRYIGRQGGLLASYSCVEDYDGSAVGTTIYRLASDADVIASEYREFVEALANPETESDPLMINPQAYVIKGQITINEDNVALKLISMQKPITILKHKFLHDNGTFREISEKVLSLKPILDIIIVDDTVYFLTMAGESLFNMERSYRTICNEKIETIRGMDIMSDYDIFSETAASGHNPRRFLAFNQGRLTALGNRTTRRAMARKFAIPLRDDKFDTTVTGVSEKIVKLLCNRGMVDPFEDSAVEVAGAKRWQ